MRSIASSFKWQYPRLSLRSSSSSLRLLPRHLVTSISPFIFPSITCFRRQFLRKMWPTQLAFRFLISCRLFLCSLTLICYRIKELCIKLVIETYLYYDARSENYQTVLMSAPRPQEWDPQKRKNRALTKLTQNFVNIQTHSVVCHCFSFGRSVSVSTTPYWCWWRSWRWCGGRSQR